MMGYEPSGYETKDCSDGGTQRKESDRQCQEAPIRTYIRRSVILNARQQPMKSAAILGKTVTWF